MDRRAWLSGIDLNMPASPNVDAIVIAVALVAGAYWIGWFAAGRVAPRITAGIIAGPGGWRG